MFMSFELLMINIWYYNFEIKNCLGFIFIDVWVKNNYIIKIKKSYFWGGWLIYICILLNEFNSIV